MVCQLDAAQPLLESRASRCSEQRCSSCWESENRVDLEQGYCKPKSTNCWGVLHNGRLHTEGRTRAIRLSAIENLEPQTMYARSIER